MAYIGVKMKIFLYYDQSWKSYQVRQSTLKNKKLILLGEFFSEINDNSKNIKQALLDPRRTGGGMNNCGFVKKNRSITITHDILEYLDEITISNELFFTLLNQWEKLVNSKTKTIVLEQHDDGSFSLYSDNVFRKIHRLIFDQKWNFIKITMATIIILFSVMLLISFVVSVFY